MKGYKIAVRVVDFLQVASCIKLFNGLIGSVDMPAHQRPVLPNFLEYVAHVAFCMPFATAHVLEQIRVATWSC
ncbi:hypothetical protein XcvCFBP7111P_07040 [Xanthomonas citri pv. vignicola]|uniref:Uncharacterized protein n=1 Tax=Xanthomonas citri pv. vignicola TaxID=473426 RepID=A0AB33CAH6_XANCI|nr:hypothetical protein XcvCFBP7111P_07040 [Xanthomonas citri pv. vignicola]